MTARIQGRGIEEVSERQRTREGRGEGEREGLRERERELAYKAAVMKR